MRRTRTAERFAMITVVGAGVLVTSYAAVVTGACPVDLGIGRRTRPLGPLSVTVAAPRETVFDVIAQPYLGRATRAMQAKVEVLERGTDMVLALHRTPVGRRLTARTLETVRFHRPDRVDFRVARAPVPHVVEAFELEETAAGTLLTYHGEMGADLWGLGAGWCGLVADRWERAVDETFAAVRAEAERRSAMPERHRP